MVVTIEESKTSLRAALQFSRWRKWQIDALLVLVALIWGSTFLVVKDTIELCGPFTFLVARFSIGAITLALIFRKRIVRLTQQEIKWGALIGLFLFGAYSLQTVGLQFTSFSKAGFITGLYVPLVPILAIFMLKQWPTFGAVVGVILSLLGLLLLSLGNDFNLEFGIGEWLVLGCAIACAFHTVSVSKFSPGVDAINLAIVQIAMVALLSFISMPLAGEPMTLPPLPVWGSALAMGVVATAFNLAIMNRVQQFVSSTHATLIYALEPAFAGLLGFFVGESFSLPAVFGCILIFLGMISSEMTFAKLRRKPLD